MDARKQWDQLPSELKEAVNMAMNMTGMPYDFVEQLDNLKEDFGDGDGPNLTPERETEISKKLRELAEKEVTEAERWAKNNLVPLLQFQ